MYQAFQCRSDDTRIEFDAPCHRRLLESAPFILVDLDKKTRIIENVKGSGAETIAWAQPVRGGARVATSHFRRPTALLRSSEAQIHDQRGPDDNP
jgi:hypothetical protein